MNQIDVQQRITKILTDQLGIDEHEVTPEARIKDDLGSDSLDDIELVMALEDEFKIDIDDKDAETMVRVKDVQSYIEARLGL